MSHLNSKCLSALQIFNRLKELPIHRTAFPLAIRPTSKQTFSIRSHAIFLPFMAFIKNCFQSEILRTVNSTSSFKFVHLAKNCGALHLRTVYNSVFRHDDSPGGSCNQSVSDSDRFCRILTQNPSLCQIGHFLAVFCTVFSVKAQAVSLCLGDSQTSL